MNIDWRKAATEFVVIVVGILAALAVDQWWQDRKDRATEAEYLARIRADLDLDIGEFTEFIRIHEAKVRFLKDLRDQDVETLLSRAPEDLLQDLVYSGYRGLPAIRSTTFDELSSTGRLALIRKVGIRDALSRYYTRYEMLSGILFAGFGDFMLIYQNSLPGELLYEWRVYGRLGSPEYLRTGIENMSAAPAMVEATNSEITYTAAVIAYLQEYRVLAEAILELLDE